MDREYVIQNDIVERYLRGNLSAEDSAAFEEHCLWCTESLDELEMAEGLRQGFKDLGPIPSGRPASRWPRFLHSPQYAAAATVLLGVSLVTSGVLYRELTSSSELGFATMQVHSLEVHRSVSGSSLQRITLGRADRPVVLVVYPDATGIDQFRVSLFRAGSDTPTWQGSAIQGTGEGLAVMLPAALLSPGTYRLRVEDADAPPGTAALADVGFIVSTEDAVR